MGFTAAELAILAPDDPIIASELARRAPKPSGPLPPPPATTAELLLRIREDPTYPAAAAQLLAEEFSDQRSWSGFHCLCERVWRGEIAPEALADAYRQACGPKARNPGAILHHAVRRRATPG